MNGFCLWMDNCDKVSHSSFKSDCCLLIDYLLIYKNCKIRCLIYLDAYTYPSRACHTSFTYLSYSIQMLMINLTRSSCSLQTPTISSFTCLPYIIQMPVIQLPIPVLQPSHPCHKCNATTDQRSAYYPRSSYFANHFCSSGHTACQFILLYTTETCIKLCILSLYVEVYFK